MRSTVTLGDVSNGTDFLIELYNLKRAYVGLDQNFAHYRLLAESKLRDAVEIAVADLKEENKHWKAAYDQENKWYKTFWFGATAATIVIVLIAVLVR